MDIILERFDRSGMDAVTSITSSFRSANSAFRSLSKAKTVGCGALAASLALYWIHLSLVTWGMTGFLLGCFCWAGLLTMISGSYTPTKKLNAVGLSFLLVTTFSSGWWWNSWDQWIAQCLQAGSLGTILGCLFHGSLLGIFCSLILWARNSQLSNQQTANRSTAGWWLGVGIGFWLVSICLSQWLPIYTLACLAGVLLLAAGIWDIFHSCSSAKNLPTEQVSTQNSTSQTAPQDSSKTFELLTSWGMAFTCAALAPVIYLLVIQLQAETTLLFYGAIASFSLGLAASGTRLFKRSSLPALFLISTLVASYPLWIEYYLALSAAVSSTLTAIALRQLGIFVFFAPLGLLTANSLKSYQACGQTPIVKAFIGCTAMISGLCASSLLVASLGINLSIIILCLILLAGISGISLIQQSDKTSLTVSRFSKRLNWATGIATVCCLVLFGRNYQPELAAKVLFSTQSFHAWRAGIPTKKIPTLDDGRLLSSESSSAGVLTIWRHQGTHYQLRQNGIPAGRISGNSGLVPHPTGGVLAAALPLSIHQTPREILVLGLDSGLPLKTTLDYPVMNVVCVEPNSSLIKQVHSGELSEVLPELKEDNRLTLLQQAPSMFLRQNQKKFDVVIESPGHSAVYRSASQFDQQHYRWISSCLSEKGIYCQRFSFTDYGPKTLASLVQSLEHVFGYVTAFDTAPGELLLIASGQQENILTSGLMERISSPQSRRNLARIGWDWSVVMNLARFESEHFQAVKSYGLQNSWQGTGAFQLATEMMRWGNKWGEIQQVLSKNPKRLIEHYQEEELAELALRRLSDVAAREQDLANHPDQFWVYRKSAKKRLLDEPRSVIEPVKGEGLQKRMHPEDQRRVDYFETLGKLAQMTPCTPEALMELEGFTAPFDPVVSYFLHPEIAKLYERCVPAQPDLELRHWLHSLYFGSNQERSVRSIHRSLTLINDTETSFTAEQRYDQLNTLLELLKIRWHMRYGRQDIAQPVLLIDLRDSLEASQRSLKAMNRYGAEAGISEELTKLRTAELEKTLVSMLRTQREELLQKSPAPTPAAQTANQTTPESTSVETK